MIHMILNIHYCGNIKLYKENQPPTTNVSTVENCVVDSFNASWTFFVQDVFLAFYLVCWTDYLIWNIFYCLSQIINRG